MDAKLLFVPVPNSIGRPTNGGAGAVVHVVLHRARLQDSTTRNRKMLNRVWTRENTDSNSQGTEGKMVALLAMIRVRYVLVIYYLKQLQV